MAVKILIPFNFTENDEKSIDFVGQRYGKRTELEITLFHAYTPVPDLETPGNHIMKPVIRNTYYLQHQQDEKKNALEAARQRLVNHGIAEQKIQCLFRPVRQNVAQDIIRLYKDGNHDVVVLSRNPGNIVNFFSRSISKQIARHVQGGIGMHIVN